MPGYIYKCTYCEFKETIQLPISYNPKEKRFCDRCKKFFAMTRRIGRPTIPDKVGRVFAGDWYKETYGHELGEGSMDKAQQAEDRKTLERELRKQTGQ